MNGGTCKESKSHCQLVSPTAAPTAATYTLGALGGVQAHTYEFARVTHTSSSGRYSDIMIAECKKHGMKPVCDNPTYCKNDADALYIGQSNHISYPAHRNRNSNFPSGWSSGPVQPLRLLLISYKDYHMLLYASC